MYAYFDPGVKAVCDVCWPSDAEAAVAWRNSNGVAVVSESHFFVKLFTCELCAQIYVRTFSETVDWVGGNDPQFITRFAVTQAEADALIRLDENSVESAVGQLGATREWVQSYWPAIGERSYGFSSGSYMIGRHE